MQEFIKTYKLDLSLKDTNILKGVALLLLLLHHLFFIQNGLYDDIQLYENHFLVNELGKFGKLCVAIFVFLSGYGLTVQANKSHEIKLGEFYKKRFTKLYLNYWFIWIIFVPIGILFYHRTFEIVYATHIWEKLIIDIAGLSFAFGFYGYNATWWFYSCIIVLYLLFPFLYRLLGKYNMILILLGLGVYLLNLFVLRSINQYLISFILGMIVANGIKFKFTIPQLNYNNKWTLLFVLIFACCIRNFLGRYAILWDSFICLIGVLLYKQIRLCGIINCTLEFIGKHSMNIFLFHTFIYAYYFESFIYSSRNPILIYLLLLGICLVLSFLIEKLKKYIGFNQLQKIFYGR